MQYELICDLKKMLHFVKRLFRGFALSPSLRLKKISWGNSDIVLEFPLGDRFYWYLMYKQKLKTVC